MDFSRTKPAVTSGIGTAPRSAPSSEAMDDEAMLSQRGAEKSRSGSLVADGLRKGTPIAVERVRSLERTHTHASAVSSAKASQQADPVQMVRDRVMAKSVDRQRDIAQHSAIADGPVHNTPNIDSLEMPKTVSIPGGTDLPAVGLDRHERTRDVVTKAADPQNIQLMRAAQSRMAKSSLGDSGATPAHAIAAVMIVAESGRDPELKAKASEFLQSRGERGAEVIDHLAKEGDIDGVAKLDRKIIAERTMESLRARATAHRQAHDRRMSAN